MTTTNRFAAIVICAGLFGAAAPAVAGPSGADQASQGRAERSEQGSRDATAKTKGQEKICVRGRMSGSNLVRTVCQTAAEWEAEGGVPN